MTAIKTETPYAVTSISFDVSKDEIHKLTEEHLSLSVRDVNDIEGKKAVHEARMGWVRLRNQIEKRRKALGEAPRQYIANVNAMAKELTDMFAPTESYLENQERIVEREQERLRQEEEAQRKATILSRIGKLEELGVMKPVEEIAKMSAGQFAAFHLQCQQDKAKRDAEEAAAAAERDRVAAEQKAEADKLAAERAEIDRAKAELAAAQAKIDAENKRIEDEQAAREEAEALAKFKAEAAEQARLDAIAAKERAEIEAKERAAAAAAEAARLEALKPDVEKLLAVADLVAAIVVPDVSLEAQSISGLIRDCLDHAASDIRTLAGRLTK